MKNCKICNYSCKLKLNMHVLSQHNLTYKEYYDKYIKTDKEGICENCGKEAKFYRNFYYNSCSHSCRSTLVNKIKWKDTNYRLKMDKRMFNSESGKIHGKMSYKDPVKRERKSKQFSELNNKNWSNESSKRILLEKLGKIKSTKNYRNKISLLSKRNWDDEEIRLRMETKTSFGIRGRFVNHNIWFSSRYEAVTIYNYLYLNNINIIRCPTKFKLLYKDEDGKQHSYYPDFYLPDHGVIIEVKSKWQLTCNNRNSNIKIDLAKSIYGEKFKLITEDDLGDIKETFNFIIKNNIAKIIEKENSS